MPSTETTLPLYLSLAQASAIVGLSARTLRRAIVAKRLRVHRVGGRVLLALAELRRWIEADGAAPSASDIQPALLISGQ